jgi:hypothetical protein
MQIKYSNRQTKIGWQKLLPLLFAIIVLGGVGVYVTGLSFEQAQQKTKENIAPAAASIAPIVATEPESRPLTLPKVDPFAAAASMQRSDAVAGSGATDCVALVAAYRQSLPSCKAKGAPHQCALNSLKAHGFDPEKYDICALFKPSPMTSPFG